MLSYDAFRAEFPAGGKSKGKQGRTTNGVFRLGVGTTSSAGLGLLTARVWAVNFFGRGQTVKTKGTN